MTDLKFGPVPNQKMTRIAIELSESLGLDAYAAEHSKLYGPVKTAGANAGSGWSRSKVGFSTFFTSVS